MAQSSGFFNAQYQDGEYDRVYNAEQFAAYFASFIGNGIFGNTMDELLPMAANPNNMSIDILSGKAWINGWWYENDETYNIPIALADGVLNRKDIVVVRWGNAERDIWLQVIQGEPAIEAVAPTIRRDADYFDLELCEINIPSGTTKITQAQITDTRLDNNVCGLVTGLVDQIDTAALYLQFNAQFNDWFEAVKEQFEGDVPEILQAQIDDLFGIISSRIETTSTSTHAYLNKDYFIYDNKLCKATKSIAIGDTISPGTGANNNCVYTTIVEEVKTGGVTVVEELADIIAMTTFNGEAAGAKAVKNLNLGLENKVDLRGGNFITGEQRLVDSREKSSISTDSYGDAYISFKDKNIGDIGAIVPQKETGNNFALALISFDNLIVQNSIVLKQSDIKNSLTSQSTITPLSAYQGYIMSRDIPWHGTSSTAASTTAKTATTSDGKFALTTGAKVSIKFTYNNTASAPTLNVDGTGDKSIKAYGSTTPTIWWQAGDVVTFTYDGTNWIMGASAGQLAQKVSLNDVVNNLTSTATDKPLSAKQGKVLKDSIARKSSVTPSNSGKTTLLSYIIDVVVPLNIGVYSFPASDFPDLPSTGWGYTVIVMTEGSAVSVIAYKHLSNSVIYSRSLNINNAWNGDWSRLGSYEIKTWSGTIGTNGLVNTGISTSEYMIVGVINDRASVVVPLSSGVNWYVQCYDLGGATPSGGNISLTLMCMRR